MMHTWGVLGYQATGDAEPVRAFHVRAATPAAAVALVEQSSEGVGLCELLTHSKLRTDTPGEPAILFAGPAPAGIGRPE
jgi:hypothetical protein